MSAEAEALLEAVRRLHGRVCHWTAARWAMSTSGATAGGMSRAEVVYALVGQIADMAAAAEGLPRRTVPRLDNDLVLGDQLRVLAADLVASGPDAAVLARATAAVAHANEAL